MENILRAQIDAGDAFDDSNPKLRPQSTAEFVGQERLIANLKLFVEAARRRNEPLDHTLLFGPPGLGKTTLANIIANEMGVSIKSTSGPIIERKDDLAAILTDLQPGDVLFIDEIHRLNRVVEECLYPAMEDFRFDILIGEGPHAKSIKLELQPFTLVGATTRAGMISAPMRTRFGITERLNFYSESEMHSIVVRSAGVMKIRIDHDGARIIAQRSRGTPRIANRLLRRVRDFAEVTGNGTIDAECAEKSLAILHVDDLGLDSVDKLYLMTIIQKFGGGPVGLNNVSVAIGEDADTIEDMVEPYLIQIGFVQRTPRGRIVLSAAYRHFGIAEPEGRDLGTLG